LHGGITATLLDADDREETGRQQVRPAAAVRQILLLLAGMGTIAVMRASPIVLH